MYDVTMATELPVPAWKTTRRPPAARPALSRDLIVDTALRLLDADGLDGVSMRRVADELGTGPASLYAHVANKEELLDLLLNRVLEEVELPEPDPKRWQDQLRELGHQLHQVFARHRDIAVVALAAVPSAPNALRVAECMFGIMLAGGVPVNVAALALDRFSLYVAGDAYEGSLYDRQRIASGLAEGEFERRHIRQVQDFFEKLPADQFPLIVKHVAALAEAGGEERFEFGLDMMVRSLATHVPKRR